MKTVLKTAPDAFAFTTQNGGRSLLTHAIWSSRSFRPIKSRNSKFKNDQKTPFFKAFQMLSKIKISIMDPTESEYIRLNPSSFFVAKCPGGTPHGNAKPQNHAKTPEI
jgi:hypothetical protein